MPQDTGKISPKYINTDAAYEAIAPEDSPFIKGLSSTSINSNPEKGNGTNNTLLEGQNVEVLTKTRSNIAIPDVIKPEGYNKNIGAFESKVTQELYYFNFNGKGNHGIYVINGNTGIWSKIIIDPKLAFSDNQENFIAEHRVKLRVIYDENKNIVEKYLIWTDGNVWQGWINVIAAIQTNGFDASLYPYWALQPPHFDREELFQYAVRPPMIEPIVTAISNTISDNGKSNEVLDKSFEFCFDFINTDGRTTTISPISVPYTVKTSDFLSNPDVLPKKANIELYAGSCMVEKINVYIRKAATQKDQYSSSFQSWSDWYLYDTINKYINCGDNSSNILIDKYWLRGNKWASYKYDVVFNTIKYEFDNTKLYQIVSQDLFSRIESDLPLRSVSLTDLGDSVLLSNNEYGYDNLDCAITQKIGIKINEGDVAKCPTPLRKIKLYVYAGRERGNVGNLHNRAMRNSWTSQVGYYTGDDKQMRFGGISFSMLNDADQGQPTDTQLVIDTDESKEFDLIFKDKEGFRCYLKGTPFYADCKWYAVKNDVNFSLIPIDGLLDSDSGSSRQYIRSAFIQSEFFVGMFEFTVPAGNYIATLGRHNMGNSDDYRGTSTYIMGIANSRLAELTRINDATYQNIRVVKPSALITYSKEIQIDCSDSDVDVWGSGADLFYVCTPFRGLIDNGTQDTNRWAFIEGYITESQDNRLPIELYPYQLTGSPIGFGGFQTDKNGFFFAYSWRSSNRGSEDARDANILFTVQLDCQYPKQLILGNYSPGNAGWKNNNNTTLADLNNGVVGYANSVLYKGKITDLTGVIGYSNIAVSIVDGSTTYTNNKGEFTLVIHNGLSTLRQSNIYVNAGGNFNLFIADCGLLPLTNYNESLAQCNYPSNIDPCTGQTLPEYNRYYPCANFRVYVQSNESQTIKSIGSYSIGIVGADLAGRRQFVNKISDISVSSYPELNKTVPQNFSWFINGAIGLNKYKYTKDIKWVSFYITMPTNYKKYIQWVGDKIEFISTDGTPTTILSNAKLVRITIDSLLDSNIKSNFTLLSNYQFANGDRLKIFDDGDGHLFDTDVFGDVIDVNILGSNYNQAAINANLIIPPTNVVLNNIDSLTVKSTVIYLNYDSRFDKLKNKTGFWIELYTPSDTTEKLPYFQIGGFYPIINGEIAMYLGGGINQPNYNYPTNAILNYWDTYLINRDISIPVAGNKFITHPFESPNITDVWGANISSGGSPNTINPNAQQLWYLRDTIRSDNFIVEGLVNGLGTFRRSNRKIFNGYGRGGIVSVVCQYSNLLFICENDWFVVDFNVIFTRASGDGIITVNLTDQMGEPHRKVGYNFGCAYVDTATVGVYDKYVWWYDSKNEGFIFCDYQSAIDISDIKDDKGNKYGVKSYFIKKTQFIGQWNSTHETKDRIDAICGFDETHDNIIVSFRPRRTNTNELSSYINHRRNFDIKHQETLVFNLDQKRWIKTEGYVAESYGKITGSIYGQEFISFSAGMPYIHNNTTRNNVKIIDNGCCPDYYSKQGDKCVKTIKNPAKKIGNISFVATPVHNGLYGINGTKIYYDYNTEGIGNYIIIPYTNLFWVNKPVGSLIGGVLNRVGFWNNTADYSPANVFITVTIPIYIPYDKIYYVGISGDDIFGLSIDCIEYFLTNGSILNNDPCYLNWNIYPINLKQGNHLITLRTKNIGIPSSGNPAAFGIELYDNTIPEIIAATSYAALNVLFTSSELFGKTVEGFNYTCDDGGCNNVVLDNGEYVCLSYEVIPTDCSPVIVNTGKLSESSFLNFYGQQTEHVIIGVLNKKEDVVKILQSISIDSIPDNMFSDMVFENQPYSFSFLPMSLIIEKEKIAYVALRRDMSSYLQDIDKEKFRSTFQDGKRIFGEYFVVRFIGDYNTLKEYFELTDINYLYTSSAPAKPPNV